MNALKKILPLLLVLCLLLAMPMAALALEGEEDLWEQNHDNMSGIQDLPDQITPVNRPIAVDDESGYIDIQIGLRYKINEPLNRNPFRYFTIAPVFDEQTKDLFNFDRSNYTQYISDLKVVVDDAGTVVDDYFSFPFWVKDDAVNGNYTLNFEVKFLNFYANIDSEQPETATIPVFFRIEHGKKAPSTTPDGGGNGGSSVPEPNPSKAMLLLDSYVMEPDRVVAGEEFDLTLKFRNTTSKSITDIKAVLSDELSTLLPANGSNTIYIDKIASGETAEATVRMRSTPECGISPAVLKIAYNYVQSKMAYEGADSITLAVSQLPNLSLDTPYYPSEVYQGDAINLMMNLFNKGKSTIYNVTVSLECEGLRAEETYFAGNMDSGVTKSYDVMAYTVEDVSGPVSGNIVVTYEDNYGVETRREVPIALNVVAMDYGMEEMGYEDEGMDVDVVPVRSGPPTWVWYAGGGAVGVALLGTILGIVKHRRRKAREADDEMD